MKTRRNSVLGILSIAVGTAIAVVSLMLASYNPLWNAFGVAPAARGSQSTGLAILSINLGFLAAVYFQQSDFRIQVLEEQSTRITGLLRSLPSTGLYDYHTGDEAMQTLAALLPTLRTVWNTRIFTQRDNPTDHPAYSMWNNAIRGSVLAGLTFKEVMSQGNQDLAQERRAATRGGRGSYQASILRYPLPSFLNFSVLENHDGSKEVWFGWVISRAGGFEGPVIRTSETRIVAMFEHWHGELFGAGRLAP